VLRLRSVRRVSSLQPSEVWTLARDRMLADLRAQRERDRLLTGAGRTLPSVRTLQRAVVRELRPAERAAVRNGEPEIRAHGSTGDWEPDHRNEIWQGDHKQLDVLVLPPRARRSVRPWSTIFIDARSRAIMGWALSLCPSTAEVLAALRDALLIAEPPPLVLGGGPERIRIDHGLDFCAEAVRAATLALSVELSVPTTYTPRPARHAPLSRLTEHDGRRSSCACASGLAKHRTDTSRFAAASGPRVGGCATRRAACRPRLMVSG
jgi:transposase InsO family protein